jgi:aspartate-semialdehyde dehydrogenase
VCVPYVHSQVVFIELEEKITREEAVESILEKDYLEFSEDILSPLDFKDRDNVGICRFNVYQDGYVVRFFSVMDNLRKGAATNAVQIAEEYVRK